jgi:hypothetical protein
MAAKRKRMAGTGPTEKANPSSRRIDLASSLKIAEIINREDQKIAIAVRSRLKEVARAIGLMSGTSLDGVDAALAEIAGRGLAIRATGAKRPVVLGKIILSNADCGMPNPG